MKLKRCISLTATLFCVSLAGAGLGRAQDNPKGEIAGNYTYIHINPGGYSTVTMGGGSGAWDLNHYLGVVGEFAGCSWSGANAHTLRTFSGRD
jgi:hypothetical protein